MAQPGAKRLTYEAEVHAPGFTAREIVTKINSLAVNNPRSYASVQQTDTTALVISGMVSVFLDYEGSHNRKIHQENYNYQLLVRASDQKFTLLMRNYISQLPNSQPLSTFASRLQYIDDMDTKAKRKKILRKYAQDEYGQLDKHAAVTLKTIESMFHNEKPEMVVK
jgi:hypothetical protein